ncbi:MAG: DNA gyrase subunit A [Lachnospirales bacterium]
MKNSKTSKNIKEKKENLIRKSITDTLKENYMPYAMSVIVSRAIPEIDGFKPSHRKLLYTMYKMGLLNKDRVKSADIVGQTMGLNPHGDSAIYETMVRLTRGNGSLLHPFVDSKGNFGRSFSKDMAYAAPRYTEAKLDEICKLIFTDIDKDTVDFVPNYNGKTTEPLLLPTSFPNILVTPNLGIAVGMASNICSFNLTEVCETTIALLKNQNHEVAKTLIAPDFTTGGELIYNKEQLAKIYESGVGSFRVQGKWKYNKKNNSIEIIEIPYTTTIEAIIDKIISLAKTNKLREVNDVRNATDRMGLKITIDLKRGSDKDLVMAKIMKLTPLSDTFSCNFNVLIDGRPQVLGVKELLLNWIEFRTSCITRTLLFDKNKLTQRLYLLQGLEKIMLDIDKAIAIIRKTEKDKDVVPNLCKTFEINEVQGEFIAEIKLRNLNKEYLLNKISEIDKIQKELDNINKTLDDGKLLNKIIIKELKAVIKDFGAPRKTQIIEEEEHITLDEKELIPDFEAMFFLSSEGYIKKVPMNSYRMANDHKLKDLDTQLLELKGDNKSTLVFFTDTQKAYTIKAYDLPEQKASNLGDYLPNFLGLESDEKVIYMCLTDDDFKGEMIFVYENGKVARVPFSSYKSSRKKLLNAFYQKTKLVYLEHILEDEKLLILRDDLKGVVINTSLISLKQTRSTQGISVLTLKKNSLCEKASLYKNLDEQTQKELSFLETTKVPSAGKFITDMEISSYLDTLS